MRPRNDPVEEITFAARLGFLTKSLWREFFFKGSLSWQNKRWNYFRSSGLFRGSSDHAELLLPNASHPLVKQLAPLVSRPPRLAQLEHDKIIARSDLALKHELPGLNTMVEAELMRRDFFSAPRALSDSTDKYPDLTLSLNETRIAVEVETSTKSLNRYRQVFEKYLGSEFDHIVYVVNNRDTQFAVESTAKEVGLPKEILRCASLREWQLDPLSASTVSDKGFEKFRDLMK